MCVRSVKPSLPRKQLCSTCRPWICDIRQQIPSFSGPRGQHLVRGGLEGEVHFGWWGVAVWRRRNFAGSLKCKQDVPRERSSRTGWGTWGQARNSWPRGKKKPTGQGGEDNKGT